MANKRWLARAKRFGSGFQFRRHLRDEASKIDLRYRAHMAPVAEAQLNAVNAIRNSLGQNDLLEAHLGGA